MKDIYEFIREIERGQRHPELKPFRKLRAAVRQGEAPDPEAVKAIADAAEFLFGDEPARDRLEAFGRALGIVKTPGKGRRPDDSRETLQERERTVRAVIRAEYRAMALEGMPRRKALSQALSDTASAEGVARRTLNRWTTEMRAKAERQYLKWLRDVRNALDHEPDPDFDPEPLPDIAPEVEREWRREIDAVLPLLEASRHD